MSTQIGCDPRDRDVLAYIFSFLRGYSIAKASRVCRAWNYKISEMCQKGVKKLLEIHPVSFPKELHLSWNQKYIQLTAYAEGRCTGCLGKMGDDRIIEEPALGLRFCLGNNCNQLLTRSHAKSWYHLKDRDMKFIPRVPVAKYDWYYNREAGVQYFEMHLISYGGGRDSIRSVSGHESKKRTYDKVFSLVDRGFTEEFALARVATDREVVYMHPKRQRTSQETYDADIYAKHVSKLIEAKGMKRLQHETFERYEKRFLRGAEATKRAESLYRAGMGYSGTFFDAYVEEYVLRYTAMPLESLQLYRQRATDLLKLTGPLTTQAAIALARMYTEGKLHCKAVDVASALTLMGERR